jgi:hypothetical protein
MMIPLAANAKPPNRENARAVVSPPLQKSFPPARCDNGIMDGRYLKHQALKICVDTKLTTGYGTEVAVGEVSVVVVVGGYRNGGCVRVTQCIKNMFLYRVEEVSDIPAVGGRPRKPTPPRSTGAEKKSMPWSLQVGACPLSHNRG